MSLFKKKESPPPAVAPPVAWTPAPVPLAAVPVVPLNERRGTARFPLQPGFPLKAVLNYIGRDDTGAPMSKSRHGWHWKGRLVDCSEVGARIQLGPGLRAVIGESCDLRLTVDDFEIVVPCHVTNLRELPEGMVFGLRHDITDQAVLRDYLQFVEVVALASTLHVRGRPKPDASGYIVERYASPRPSALTVWRHPVDGAVSAIELILKDSMVRLARGLGPQYFAGDGRGSRPATAMRSVEIHRLFRWVVPNLPPTMPADLRNFLGYFAA